MLCILSTLRDFWISIIRAIVYQDIASLTRMGTVHRWRRRKASCWDRWHGRHWEICARFQSRQREFTTNWNFTSRPGKIVRIKNSFQEITSSRKSSLASKNVVGRAEDLDEVTTKRRKTARQALVRVILPCHRHYVATIESFSQSDYG